MLSYSSVPEVPTLRIATDADGVHALRQLVDILGELAHPSVIAIETTRFEKTSAEVVLAEVTGTSLRSGWDIDALVKATASAAAALARVHDHDIALKAFDTNTFVIRKDLSAVLYNLDTATHDASEADKREDLRLFAEFATTCAPEVDRLRDRINNVGPSPLRESFVRILEQAAKGDLDARGLAEKLRHALWFDNVTSTPNTPETKPSFHVRLRRRRNVRLSRRRNVRLRQRRNVRPGRRVGIATATVVVALAIVAGTRLQSGAAPSPQKTPLPSCQLRTGTTVDVDNDGCTDVVSVQNGKVTINGERYAVGDPGDEMAIGNWNCTGKTTLALLRPATGELFVFDSWPKAGDSAKPRVLQTGTPATGLHAVPTDGCDALGVGPQQFDTRKAQ